MQDGRQGPHGPITSTSKFSQAEAAAKERPGASAHLTKDEKPADRLSLKREHLIDQVCIQEILPPKET
jgi:hypothetical protein